MEQMFWQQFSIINSYDHIKEWMLEHAPHSHAKAVHMTELLWDLEQGPKTRVEFWAYKSEGIHQKGRVIMESQTNMAKNSDFWTDQLD
jgi:hypothetical protein